MENFCSTCGNFDVVVVMADVKLCPECAESVARNEGRQAGINDTNPYTDVKELADAWERGTLDNAF